MANDGFSLKKLFFAGGMGKYIVRSSYCLGRGRFYWCSESLSASASYTGV